MGMKDYDFFKAEERLRNDKFAFEALIDLKRGMLTLLEGEQSKEHAKLKKRYTKDIQKYEESLALVTIELETMQAEYFGAQEEKESSLPEDILQMSTNTVSGIEEFNKRNEELIKFQAQAKELLKEITRIKKLTPEQVQMLESFLNHLENIYAGLESQIVEEKKIVDELNIKSFREVGELIDAIDRFQKGYWPPKQMQ